MIVAALGWLLVGPALASGLDETLGRSEVRVWSAAYPLHAGRTVQEMRLVQRLDRLGYRRVHEKPREAGEFFWGQQVFWIYRRPFRLGGHDHGPRLISLLQDPGNTLVLGRLSADAETSYESLGPEDCLEPELLAESLSAKRVRRELISLDAVPEDLWRAVLAAEDSRFFEHHGVDSRGIARAMLANLKAGKVVQGGSTITQQLVKNRSLTPKRSLPRKVSEAVRALALEAEYDKRDILENYLNSIYWGQIDGLALYGVGTAARAYFSKSASELSLVEAATLAGMIQGPNLHNPLRNPQRSKTRRDWVLSRMETLGWATPAEVSRARQQPLRTHRGKMDRRPAPHFLSWVAAIARDREGKRLESGKGVVLETTLDPLLQELAQSASRNWLARLRKSYPRLRSRPLSLALVALDVKSGQVLAYVGGDSAARGDAFDRAQHAHRQPGSAIKPLLLLEAFESCGASQALNPATRVLDESFSMSTPGGSWTPANYDRRTHGVVSIREALRHSYNIPFVRIARHCGFRATARRVARTGLEVEDDPPPSFALGSLEVTPLEMARAYRIFPTLGRVGRPRALTRIEKPSGRRLKRWRDDSFYAVHSSTAYLVHQLLLDAVASGTGKAAGLEAFEVAGKTGSSSALRDAWFVGYAGSVVTAVWVGLDDDGSLGLTGSAAAAPLFRNFMEAAVPAREPHRIEKPRGVRVRRVDPTTGLLVSERSRRGYDESFRRGKEPRRDRWWRRDDPARVIR